MAFNTPDTFQSQDRLHMSWIIFEHYLYNKQSLARLKCFMTPEEDMAYGPVLDRIFTLRNTFQKSQDAPKPYLINCLFTEASLCYCDHAYDAFNANTIYECFTPVPVASEKLGETMGTFFKSLDITELRYSHYDAKKGVIFAAPYEDYDTREGVLYRISDGLLDFVSAITTSGK